MSPFYKWENPPLPGHAPPTLPVIRIFSFTPYRADCTKTFFFHFLPFIDLSEVNHRMSATLDQVRASIDRNGVAIKGVINIPDISFDGELQNLNQKFRNVLDLYAHVVRVKSLSGVNSKYKNLDFVIIREQTEGEYAALEHESIKGVVECLKVVTAEKSKRIAKFAFDYATRHGRKKVIC